MTNFNSEACNELVISEVEAKELTHQLSSNSGGLRKNTMRTRQSLNINEEEMDATSVAYLRTTYSQRDQVGLQFVLSDDVDEQGSATKRVKRKINMASMDVEGSVLSDSSYESNNEICELTRNLNNMQFTAAKLKPIITFTPVHSAEDEEEGSRDASPFSDRRSSGSSSPLLEVPMCAFPNMSAEMMRPPLN